MNHQQGSTTLTLIGVLFGAYLVYVLHEFLAVALMCGGALYALQLYSHYNRK